MPGERYRCVVHVFVLFCLSRLSCVCCAACAPTKTGSLGVTSGGGGGGGRREKGFAAIACFVTRPFVFYLHFIFPFISEKAYSVPVVHVLGIMSAAHVCCELLVYFFFSIFTKQSSSVEIGTGSRGPTFSGHEPFFVSNIRQQIRHGKDKNIMNGEKGG